MRNARLWLAQDERPLAMRREPDLFSGYPAVERVRRLKAGCIFGGTVTEKIIILANRKRIRRRTGLPVCGGLGASKTLARHIAMKNLIKRASRSSSGVKRSRTACVTACSFSPASAQCFRQPADLGSRGLAPAMGIP